MFTKDDAIAKLISLREEKVIKVKDIALVCGVKTSSVSCWLTGVSSPTVPHLELVNKLIKTVTYKGKGKSKK